MSLRLGGVETGGTTFKLSLALDHPTNVIKQVSIPTTTPNETLDQVVQILHEWDIDSVGIASFGPIDINKSSPTYGYITTTPKPNWGNVDLVGSIRRGLIAKAKEDESEAGSEASFSPLGPYRAQKYEKIQFGFNTDCNAAAAVELLYGQDHDDSSAPQLHDQQDRIKSIAYITIGTGIGIGVAIDITSDCGKSEPNPQSDQKTQSVETTKLKLITNMLHPEAGHIPVRRHQAETLVGSCPYHGDCLEGLSNNHSTAKRSGCAENQLPELDDSNPTWDITAYYIAQLCTNLIYIVSPEKIVIGGGLAKRGVVMDSIRKYTQQLNNNYVCAPQLKNMTTFITSSYFDRVGSNTSPGAVGALWLGYE